MQTDTTIFSADNLIYRYNRAGVLALDKVSINLKRGEFVAIVGPSGCGKSTLLRVIAQLNEDALNIIKPLDRALIDRGKVAVMFQSAVLYPWLNVWDNLLLPRKLVQKMELSNEEFQARAETLLRKVGLYDFRDRYCFQLSGGMQQRLCLARSLLMKPEILLLDEPFGALDAITREELNNELQTLWLEEQQTVLLITHDVAEAVFLSDRVLVMSDRPGRIKAEYAVELPRPRPDDVRFSAEFNSLAAAIHRSLQ